MGSSNSAILKHIGIITLVVACLVAMNTAWLVPVVRGLRRGASDDALNLARTTRAEINKQVDLVIQDLEITASELSFTFISEQLVLDRALQRNESFKSIAIVDLYAQETIKVDRFKIVKDGDLIDHGGAIFLNNAMSGQTSLGPVFISEDFEPHMLIAVPQTELGVVVNVLVADFNLRTLLNDLDVVEVLAGGVFVVDKNGFQIFHPDITELLKNVYLGDQEWVRHVIDRKQALSGLEPEVRYRNKDGREMFTVGLPFLELGWGVFVEQPRADVLSEERRAVFTAVVLFVVGLLASLAVYVGNLRLRDLSRRLQDLINENHESSKMLVRRDLELSEANLRLEELDQIKSEFVSVAAHQLRTPLTGIRWSLHTLLESSGKLSVKQNKLASNTLKITLTAIEIINSLLNVARIEEGRSGLTLKVQNIKPVIDSAIESAKNHAEEKELSITAFVPDSLPKCKIDSNKIAVVLENIFNNAIKYTKKGGQITLHADVSGEYLEITITDTGIGIPESQQHRMFSQFFRASNARKLSPEGTGLGLYMVANLVERHGGSVSFISTEDEGTSIKVLLPIEKKV